MAPQSLDLASILAREDAQRVLQESRDVARCKAVNDHALSMASLHAQTVAAVAHRSQQPMYPPHPQMYPWPQQGASAIGYGYGPPNPPPFQPYPSPEQYPPHAAHQQHLHAAHGAQQYGGGPSQGAYNVQYNGGRNHQHFYY